MTDEVTPSTTQGTEAATESEAPKDFREYAKWRATGDLPEKQEDTPAAAGTGANATETPAKTEPDSEPEKTQAAEDDDIDETDDVAKGRAGSRRRKLEKLTRENEELKRLVAERSVQPQDKPSEPAKAEGKPKLEDFQTLEEYQEALTDWKLDQREKAKAEAEAKRAHDTAEREAFETWAKREKAAKKAHEDYEDTLETVTIPDGPGVPAARQAMLESELGAEILYHLAKQPNELKRIAALSPVSAVREIGKLEAALQKSSSAPENGTPRITGAPKPPPPTGRPSKTSSDTPEEAAKRGDFRAYAKLRALERR